MSVKFLLLGGGVGGGGECRFYFYGREDFLILGSSFPFYKLLSRENKRKTLFKKQVLS